MMIFINKYNIYSLHDNIPGEISFYVCLCLFTECYCNILLSHFLFEAISVELIQILSQIVHFDCGFSHINTVKNDI